MYLLALGVQRQLNIPNALSLFRAVAIIPIVGLVSQGYWQGGMMIFLIAAVTDYLDGWIARKYEMVTPLGKELDPVADKFLMNGVFVLFLGVTHSTLLSLLVIVNVLYDLDNTYRRQNSLFNAIYGISQKRAELPVTSLSKVKTTILFFTGGGLFLSHIATNQIGMIVVSPTASVYLVNLVDALVMVSCIFVLLSWYNNRVRRRI